MKSRIRTSLTLCALSAGLTMPLGAASAEGADRTNRSIDSGQPRELINQPACWPADPRDEAGHCEVAKQI
jgi:hypothetical protein